MGATATLELLRLTTSASQSCPDEQLRTVLHAANTCYSTASADADVQTRARCARLTDQQVAQWCRAAGGDAVDGDRDATIAEAAAARRIWLAQ